MREHGRQPRWGWGPESSEPGLHPLLSPPLRRAGERSAAVMKQHPKMGLFHSGILTALTCFAGIPALCQAGESSDAELPNLPNIKGNGAVPMGLVLLPGHRNVASELPFEEPGSEVQQHPRQQPGGAGHLSHAGLYLLCSTNQHVSK